MPNIELDENRTELNYIDFGFGAPGSAAKTVLPNSSQAAKLTITGEPDTLAGIFLPVYGTLHRTDGGNFSIDISEFTTDHQWVLINSSGTADIFIGATAAALPVSLPPGNYVGEVEVKMSSFDDFSEKSVNSLNSKP